MFLGIYGSYVILTKYPDRATSLLLYQSSIAKLSQKFKWPSWVIYDNAYRQEAADNSKEDWSKIDSSLHSQCFMDMAITTEGWCSICHSVEHIRRNCPLNSQGASQQSAPRQPPPKRFKESWPPVCKKFNRNDGYCEYMPKCNYRHVCLQCHGPHPETRCQAASGRAKLQ